MQEYLVPVEGVVVEQKVKKSLFICQLERCTTREEAAGFIDRIRKQHKGANHNCWAFIAGSPDDPSCHAMSDDGEPKGCAGRPMFNVLIHSGIGEVCAVVSRYFGGIKLGTGGMARAYSQTVQLGLEELQTERKIHYTSFNLVLPYSLQKKVEMAIGAAGGRICQQNFATDVRLTVEIPTAYADTFRLSIMETGQGVITCI